MSQQLDSSAITQVRDLVLAQFNCRHQARDSFNQNSARCSA